MDEARELISQIGEVHSLYLQLNYDYWIQYALFTWQWWLLLSILVMPWYYWWLKVDKSRLLEIWCYGTLTFIAVIVSDEIGVANNYWIYPINLSPNYPHILSPVDITGLPVIFMLVYQSYPKWKQFVIASIVMAMCTAFIGEPMLVRMGIYELLNWKYYYSFPIYIVFAIILKFIIETIKSIQQKNAKR